MAADSVAPVFSSPGNRATDEGAEEWAPLVADQLRAEHIEALLKQKIAYVLIPGLLPSDWCEEITRRFLAFMAEHPDYRVNMRTSYVDMVVMPMNVFMRPDSGEGESSLDEYFARVPRDRPRLREIYAGGPDPFELVSALWRETGWTELPALEGTRPYHTDVLWGLTAPSVAAPHIDTYHRDTPCSLSRFPRRFSCNTFIQAPESGGDFRVHRHRREDGPFGVGRHPPFADYRVRPGDLLVFDSGNFHEVLPIAGSRHRLFSHTVAVLDPESREYSIFA
jgi:hypothetical protein